MTTAPTPEALLSQALGFTAPATVTEVCGVVRAETVAQLAHAIDRRVYIAIKDHDEKVAFAIEEYMKHAREWTRLRVVGQTTDVSWAETAVPSSEEAHA
jgi:hypothetical protein